MKETLQLPAQLAGHIWTMRAANSPRRRPHRHDELEVNLILNGRGRYLLEDRAYELTRRTQIWLFPAQEHVLLDFSADFEMWVLVFRPALVRQACTTPATRPLRQLAPATHFCRQLTEQQTRRLAVLFAEITQLTADPARFNAGLAYTMLTAWAAQSASEIVTGGNIHPAVERAVHFIRRENTPVTLDDIAQHAGLSPARLSRVFLEQTGMSITTFRNRQRIERFLSLYTTGTGQKILETALAAGFGSYPQFHRIFKQEVGCTPAAYRRTL
ncbi:MAG: AraC family transcriptional regulator [Verrucomicrobiota bacterium]